jgi:DNA-binding protein HU-beta
MKKADFIRIVSERTSLSKKDVANVISASVQTIQDALISGHSVTFMGFGTFDTIERAPRETTLPGSKQKVKVPARTSVRFRVGKRLKTAVANLSEQNKTNKN